ncbi:acyl-CoA dehydrogenase family protein [Paeniglutamicibacter antarcticus]|uniref:Acyl-CoA dehydrogenase family protein n=1 Tax=Arthrobacter terrae TaxID=2935737 RepID=A0A931CQ73_9MICC|nr:acyl-CoA dehydrogenase family protein [Arthrobacter terrae]MBG0740121.1 acyl-CoA dehydrogenase family protein [Arthrobacter terrae]
MAGDREELPQADFYDFEALLSDSERGKLAQLREFLAAEVAPFAADWWNVAEFPAHILPALARLELSSPALHGYSHLFAGFVVAEMTRVDTSLATFFLVHHDLFVQSLQEFGSEEQKSRLLADAMALRITGAFALTEPDHGSDVAGGMTTTATRIRGTDGCAESWVVNGSKRWIGNGTFCDYMLLWAKDTDTGQVRGFILDAHLPGVTRTKIEHKIALRTVQNAHIVLENVTISEADRFAGIDAFADTNQLLLGSRVMVAWQAVGQQLAAFDVARAYAVERQQFGRPLARFQLVQQQLVQMLGNATASLAMMVRIAGLRDAADAGGTGARMEQVALAKAFTTARMRETVAMGRAVLGGNGIVTDYGMAKIFADAEAIYTYEGSHEINTLITGRAITGVSAIV